MMEDDEPRREVVSLEINPFVESSLESSALHEALRAKRRLHVKELLSPAAAEQLYHAISGDLPFSTFLAAHGRVYEAPHEVQREYAEEQAAELIDLAHRSARERGFGYVYDALRLEPDEGATPLHRLAALLVSERVTTMLQSLLGMGDIGRIEVRAMRLRQGHFMSFHDAIITGDKEGKARALFSYDLTPEWRPEWGGVLSLRGEEGHLVEALAPCFNCLDVFALPQGRWLSAVSPLATAPAYSVCGVVFAR